MTYAIDFHNYQTRPWTVYRYMGIGMIGEREWLGDFYLWVDAYDWILSR
jgi:hypothetical protein